MLWLEMGLGKTIVTLTSIQHLLSKNYLRGVLIVAPIRVVRMVWEKESRAWDHTKDLKFSYMIGSRDTRTRALLQKADVYLINYENLKWLSDTLHVYFTSKKKPIPFDGLVWDEISKMKNSTSARVKSYLKIHKHFKWLTGLTGTPASNGYKDLHGQFLVVDGGERLGVYKTVFETKYYRKEGPYKKIPYKDTEDSIKKLISDITIEMSAKDYLTLPKIIFNNVWAELPDANRTAYEIMEKEFFLQLDNGENLEMFNKAALTNKCLQFSNGAVYVEPGSHHYEVIHDAKLDALEEILEESQDRPVFCAYSFKSDADRIMKRFKPFGAINLTDCKTSMKLMNAMNHWENGKCKLMIGHPASMGHGIDGFQRKGNILVWFGLNWSLDLYDQFNARIMRQGQEKTVFCHRILVKDTLDEAQMEALNSKSDVQTSLKSAINSYRKRKENISVS